MNQLPTECRSHAACSLVVSMLATAVGLSPDSSAQTTQLLQVDGTVANGRFGSSVAQTSDLDGDGRNDLAIGIPGAGVTGRIHIVSSANGSLILSLRGPSVPPPPSFPPISSLRFQGLGASLASRVADGSTVLLAGAPDSDLIQTATTTDTGAVLFAHIAPPQHVVMTGRGEDFGAAVARIGDVDGDHFADHLVGAPLAGSTGRARVISGKDGSIVRTHDGVRGVHASFGATVAGLGDVDQDLVPDYAIADPHCGVNGVDSGQVRIFSGSSGALLRTIDGNSGDGFGSAIVCAGRASGSLLLAIGAPHARLSGARLDSGYVRIYNATTGVVVATLEGNASFARFGSALSIGNDPLFAQGGSNDLVVGAPGTRIGGRVDVGEVFTFSLAGFALVHSILNPSGATGDRFGESVSAGGDGGDYDIAVGAPGFGSNDSGRAYVFLGNGTLRFTLPSTFSGARFGAAVAYFGDVDGDDVSEIAVGAPDAGGNNGIVQVFSGASGQFIPMSSTGAPNDRVGAALCGIGNPASAIPNHGLVIGIPGDDAIRTLAAAETDTRGPSNTAGAHAGRCVAVLGDVDGDLVTDFAIGSPDESTGGGAGSGRASVISGGSLGTIRSIDGLSSSEALGTAISDLGDVNNDGRADFAIGAPGFDIPVIGRANVGAVRIVDGSTGAILRSIQGLEAGETLGAALAGLGDVNGNGIVDLAIGAPGFDGLLGTDVGRIRIVSTADGSVIRTVTGSANGDRLGSVLAPIGDQDADGVRDLLVGVPLDELNGTPPDIGHVDLLSSGTGATLVSVFGANIANAHLGAAVASGDFNGDCLEDIVAASPDQGAGRVRILARFTIPTSSSSFGSGCPGTAGFVPHATTLGGTPVSVGSPGFGIAVACAASNAPALLMLGFSDSNWNGVPLPFDATPIGFSGCSLLASGDVLFSATTHGPAPGLGFAIVPTPVPNDSSLTGAVLFAQWTIIDPGAPNGLGAMSQALRIVIQQVL